MQQIFKLITLAIISNCVIAYTVISVSDNQIDIAHKDLVGKIFKNKAERIDRRDNDRNGKIDDISGWNFVLNSGVIFDPSKIGTFDSRIPQYYEIRKKKTLKIATKEELSWYKKLIKDKDFKKSKDEFTKYNHGSHIACLAMNARTATPYEVSPQDIKLLPIRYIGKEGTGLFKKIEFSKSIYSRESNKVRHIEKFLNTYADWMVRKLTTTVEYSSNFSNIYHGSWGQGWASAHKMIRNFFMTEFDISEEVAQERFKEEIATLQKNYMNNLLNQGKKLFSRHPKVVFVFSAGNKKENTDVDLHYPSSIILDNVISVGASDENGNDFAYFTNFGKKTVTLMGPGIAIDSCSPGDKYLPINGTSQAAPQVTNTIANMIAIAESKDRVISPRTIKAILIQSSTKYKSLREKSVSGGVLNTKKAYQLTREHLRKH